MKHLIKSIISLFLLTFFISCAEQDRHITESDVTSEEYFTGIFLLGNDLTDKIPTFNGARSILKQEFSQNRELESSFNQLNREILNFVSVKDPQYLDELKTAIERREINYLDNILSKGAHLLAIFHMENKLTDNVEIAEIANDILEKNDYDLTNSEDLTLYLDELRELDLDNTLRGNSANPDQDKCLIVSNVAVATNTFVVTTSLTLSHTLHAVFVKTHVVGLDKNDDDQSKVNRELLIHQILQLN